MSYPTNLLKQSKALLKLDPKRPNQANVRRAVSSGYYAVYHHLLDTTSEAMFGKGRSMKLVRDLYTRNVDHNRLREVSKKVSTHGQHISILLEGKKHLQPSAKMEHLFGRDLLPEELIRFCESFTFLQEQRHLADYDLTFKYSKYDADDVISAAEEAISNLSNVARFWPDLLTKVGALILFGPEFRH